MNKQTFFSIILPTYNRAHCLTKTIESVLSLIYESYELIIVDDGSTDNTEKLVEGFDDPRIRYHKKNNEERGKARNFGISKAKGDYVCFLDSDDLVLPNHLIIANEFIANKSNPAVFHLDYAYLYPNGEIVNRQGSLTCRLNDFLIKENKLSCNGVFIRKNIAEKHQFIAHRSAVVGEDSYLWLILASRFDFFHVDTVTSLVVKHEERSLNDINPFKFLKSTLLVLQHLSNDEVFMKYYKSKVYHYFARRMLLVALMYAQKGKSKWTLFILSRALKYNKTIFLHPSFLVCIKLTLLKRFKCFGK